MPYNDDAREPSSVTGRALATGVSVLAAGLGVLAAGHGIKAGLSPLKSSSLGNFASSQDPVAHMNSLKKAQQAQQAKINNTRDIRKGLQEDTKVGKRRKARADKIGDQRKDVDKARRVQQKSEGIRDKTQEKLDNLGSRKDVRNKQKGRAQHLKDDLSTSYNKEREDVSKMHDILARKSKDRTAQKIQGSRDKFNAVLDGSGDRGFVSNLYENGKAAYNHAKETIGAKRGGAKELRNHKKAARLMNKDIKGDYKGALKDLKKDNRAFDKESLGAWKDHRNSLKGSLKDQKRQAKGDRKIANKADRKLNFQENAHNIKNKAEGFSPTGMKDKYHGLKEKIQLNRMDKINNQIEGLSPTYEEAMNKANAETIAKKQSEVGAQETGPKSQKNGKRDKKAIRKLMNEQGLTQEEAEALHGVRRNNGHYNKKPDNTPGPEANTPEPNPNKGPEVDAKNKGPDVDAKNQEIDPGPSNKELKRQEKEEKKRQNKEKRDSKKGKRKGEKEFETYDQERIDEEIKKAQKQEAERKKAEAEAEARRKRKQEVDERVAELEKYEKTEYNRGNKEKQKEGRPDRKSQKQLMKEGMSKEEAQAEIARRKAEANPTPEPQPEPKPEPKVEKENLDKQKQDKQKQDQQKADQQEKTNQNNEKQKERERVQKLEQEAEAERAKKQAKKIVNVEDYKAKPDTWNGIDKASYEDIWNKYSNDIDFGSALDKLDKDDVLVNKVPGEYKKEEKSVYSRYLRGKANDDTNWEENRRYMKEWNANSPQYGSYQDVYNSSAKGSKSRQNAAYNLREMELHSKMLETNNM